MDPTIVHKCASHPITILLQTPSTWLIFSEFFLISILLSCHFFLIHYMITITAALTCYNVFFNFAISTMNNSHNNCLHLLRQFGFFCALPSVLRWILDILDNRQHLSAVIYCRLVLASLPFFHLMQASFVLPTLFWNPLI